MMKTILLLAVAFLLLAIARNYPLKLKNERAKSSLSSAEPGTLKRITRVKSHAKLLKMYAKRNRFDTSVVFLVDMSLPSGKKRFFVYDLINDSIKTSGLVAHGGGNNGYIDAVFSNTPNSGYSSMGKYKIGGKYKGSFGTAFKLFGLDSSNSNAYKRFVVLHGHSCVPDYEVYPTPICNSLGCPTVSVNFLALIEKEIARASKPLLLWVMQ